MQAGRFGGLGTPLRFGGVVRSPGAAGFPLPGLAESLPSPVWADGPAKLRWVAIGAAASVCLLVRLCDCGALPDALLAVLFALVPTYSLALTSPRFGRGPAPGQDQGSPAGLLLGFDLVVLSSLIIVSGGPGSPLVPFLLLSVVAAPFVVTPPEGAPARRLAVAPGTACGLAAAGLLIATAAMGQGAFPWPAAAEVWPSGRLLSYLVGWIAAMLLVASVADLVARRSAQAERGRREAWMRLEQKVQELRESNLELERLARTRTSPMLRVAHQLRAPLSSIQGLLDAILKGYADGAGASTPEMIELARDSAAGMLALVNDLLCLGHIRDVGCAATGELVDPGCIVLEVARSSQGLAYLRRLEMVTSVSDDVPRIRGDGEFTRQLVLNLVENAVKYTPTGGRIAISARGEAGRAVISVSDTGIGIKAEDQPRVFEEFFRSEDARRMQRVGTGLGLAIARQIAEQQGGEMTVVSELGRGSTFTVSLPAATGAEPEDGLAVPVGQDARRGGDGSVALRR